MPETLTALEMPVILFNSWMIEGSAPMSQFKRTKALDMTTIRTTSIKGNEQQKSGIFGSSQPVMYAIFAESPPMTEFINRLLYAAFGRDPMIFDLKKILGRPSSVARLGPRAFLCRTFSSLLYFLHFALFVPMYSS
jgi:hypothetical protein